ncbi:hypothetical protein DFH06DRAFT_1166064 [Mycena polygramma]|nr:hypothetical protein DFH06DRAFT_1166064 [Mycena polygramma]
MDSRHRHPCSFESSVEHLLHTNAAPTDQQCASIREHILVQPLRDLNALDEEMKRLRRSINELNTKRVALAADIDAHLALLTPVRHLPDDILREIFMSSLPTTHNAVMASREAPFLLCHVASRWRNIALSTPQLWSSLHLVIPDQPRSQNIYALVEQWLARSGTLPLSISVAISSSMNSEVVTASPLDLLVAVSNRWKSVEFAASPDYRGDWLCRSLSALHPADVPILTSFKFNSADKTMLSSPFLATPTLSSVSLLFIPHDFRRDSAFSWHSITRLQMGSKQQGYVWGGCEIPVTLQHCINLEVCTLTIVDTPAHQIPNEPIELPHLKSLSVICQERRIARAIIRCINAPELVHLECSEPLDASSKFPFAPLIANASKLRNLSIAGRFLRSLFLEIITTNMGCPSLETLEISSGEINRADEEDWSIDNDILYALRRVLPALKTLQIHGCSKLGEDALLSFITAQTAAGTPLRRLDIIFARRMVEDTLAPLAPFISNGLVASLKYVDPDDGKSRSRARYSPWEFTDVVR